MDSSASPKVIYLALNNLAVETKERLSSHTAGGYVALDMGYVEKQQNIMNTAEAELERRRNEASST